MPLRAVSGTENVHAFNFDELQWAHIKKNYRSLDLRIPCCSSAAIPKTSVLGNKFFAHSRKGECTTAPESAEHLYCKALISQAAQSAGWTVTTERRGVSPASGDWVADVFCEKGKAQIAFEIQMSPQTHEETVYRQLRYKASNVRAAWFYASKISHGTIVFDRNTPVFSLNSFKVGEIPRLRRFDVDLPQFVTGMLNRQLVWTVPQYDQPLYVEFLIDTCWACHKPVKQVYGFLKQSEDAEYEFHPRALTVASISQAIEAVQVVISNDELIAQGLNIIGKQNVINGKKTVWPYCNMCLHCRAPQNNFQLGEKLSFALYKEGEEAALLVGLAAIARTVLGEGHWVFLTAPS